VKKQVDENRFRINADSKKIENKNGLGLRD
jgi:hypothetical protein